MSREQYCDRSPAAPQRGAIALLALLILLAASLTLTTGLSLRGITNLQSVSTLREGEEAFSGADGCVMEALRRLRDNSAYQGGTWTLGWVRCLVTVTDEGGGQRTIRAAATVGRSTRRIRAVAQVGSVVLSGRTVRSLSLSVWEETTD